MALVGANRGIACGTSEVKPNSKWDVLTSVFVYIPLTQAVVYEVNGICVLLEPNCEVLWLDVSIYVFIAVK